MPEIDFNKNYNLEKEIIITNDGDSVSLKLFASGNCSFFDGHFPEFKLMPAVGQFGIVAHLAKKYFGMPENVCRIKRMKFSMPIVPDSWIKIDLDCNRVKKEMFFLICDLEDNNKIYASGKFA